MTLKRCNKYNGSCWYYVLVNLAAPLSNSKKQIHQIELQLEELETQAAQTVDTTLPCVEKAVTPKRRISLPEHLLREERRVEPAKTCPDCTGKLKHIGNDVSEVLEVVPASYRVIKIVRHKYSCTCCDTLIQGEAPHQPPKALPVAYCLRKSWLINTLTINRYNANRSAW